MYGDQLFEECVRNVQWIFRVGNDVFERLEGFIIEFVDWYVKVILYKVCEVFVIENVDVFFSNFFLIFFVCLFNIIIIQDLYILID